MSLVVALLAALLPEHFRDRQREEWLADLATLPRGSRLRYLTTAAITLPSLRAAARRHGSPSAYGLRRLVPPPDLGARLLIVLFAASAGLFAGAVAGRLMWTPQPPLLSAAESRALAGVVFPGRVVTGAPTAPAFRRDADGRQLPGSALFRAVQPEAGRDVAADSRLARDRLVADGWIVDVDIYDPRHPGPAVSDPELQLDSAWDFRVHKANLTLTFTGYEYGDPAFESYQLGRTTAPDLPVVPILATVAVGALLGWLAACRLIQRAGAGLVAAMLVAVHYGPPLGPEPEAPWWYPLFVEHPARWAILMTALVIGLVGHRRRSDRGHRARAAVVTVEGGPPSEV